MSPITADAGDKLGIPAIGALLFGEGPAHLDIEAIALLDPVDVGDLTSCPSVIYDLPGKVDALQAIFGDL